MVRETRHLWVGNLPHTIREERILDHFKRYGKVQSVKILPKKEDESGTCATVAFIDIKSAAKAHNADNKIDERTLKTDYYEPPASSTASSAIFIHERDDTLVRPSTAPYAGGRSARYQHGLPEERNYDRTGHYYERIPERESYLRRPIGMGYHDDDNYQGRGKSRDRYSRNSSGGTYTEGAERNQSHFRTHNARQHFEQQRYPASDQYVDDRDATSASSRLSRRPNAPTSSIVASVASPPHSRSESRQRRIKRRSPSRSPSGSRSNSRSRSRSRSSSGSRSSSSSSKLQSSSSDTSSRSRSPSKSRSPAASYGSQSNAKGSRLDRPASAIANPSSTASYLPSAVTSSAINCTPSNSQGSIPSQGCMPASNENSCEKDEKRPLGICVRNLPVRSTDTSLKDGLFHEYKKHGKVTMVKVIGQGTERYAVVCFKKPEDVEKALEVSKDKLFFGCKIEVTAHEGLDAEDNEFRPLEAELDEYHPKATRTLFIGNLEKDITTVELRKHFDQFGEIIEIDIKKQGAATSYAFIQYSDIASVVKAMRKLDGENLGANRIKLGFGKSMPTNCVWLDGIVDGITEKFLARHFSRFGPVAYATVDREKGHALVFYDSVEFAQIAVSEMRGRILGGKKLQVDFASRECQTTFFDKLEMTGQMVPGDRPWERRERRGEFEIIRDDRDARVGFENRVYPRYDSQSRTTRGNFRGIQRAGFNGRGRGQGFSARYEIYHDEFGERRHRNYDEEYSQGSGASFEDSYEQELREYGYSQRERREYATDDRGMIARSFSPVRRRDTNSMSPPPKERHRDDRSTSPHARSERTSTSSRGDKHEDHPRERYGSREESTEESTTFETKMERVKYGDPVECQGRKRNKLRNSISDQESHHSQSPPHSRHHSRSISPPSKERKSIKDRLHHRIKSPSSHSSSQMNSPCREVVADDVIDINADYRDCRHKCGEEKVEQRDVSDNSFSLTSTKCDPCADSSDKIQPKIEVDLFKRRSIESECIEENLCVSDQLSQLERKRRLLASATSVALSKDINVITTPKLICDRSKLKTSTIIHSNLQKSGRANCVSAAISGEDVKSDTESGELQEEGGLEKPIQSESANSLKSLQKKQVQILHLLEQLQEGVNSSDTEGSTDSEKPSHKKPRSASSCIELNVYGDNDISKAITKEECSTKLIKSGLKENSLFSRGKIKSEAIDSSNCIALSLDSLIFRKHLDPRKGFDQQSLSLTSVSRLQKSRRTSVEKDDSYVPNSQGTSEPFLCLPSTAASDGTWRKQCASLSESIIAETDAGDVTPRIKGREENLSDDTSSSSKKKSFQSAPPPLLLESPKSFPLRTFPDSLACHETKREISPLSLPLPKFAASLRSPKSSPNPLTSPKSSALSPRAGHSPSTFLSSKVLRIPEVLQEIKNEKKSRNQETKESITIDDRLNGANMSPVHTTASIIESQQPTEVPTELMPSLPSIQSPKSSTAKSKENSSSDSECSPVSSPNRPSIEERIKALDEKFNAWSGSTRTVSNSLPEVAPSVIDYQKYSIKKRSRFNFLTSEFRTEPSEIVKSLLAKSTIFDQDSKRLEHINEKYEPKEIKLDLSPKLKPTFRTKAAAKEFSTPITPSLQTYNQTTHGKFPSLVTTGTLSPPLTPQTTANNNTIPSPVALSPASHYSHTSPQHFAPCSLVPSLGVASSSVKVTTESSIIQHKETGEQAGLASKPLETVKIKTEQELPITSSMPVTLVPTKVLTSVSSSSSVIPHSVLPNSLSSNIKKEQIAQKEHSIQISNKEQIENKDFCVKKEFPLLHVSNIPPRRDCTVAVIKDQAQYKDINSIEHCRKETYTKESSDRKDLLHNAILREGSNQWRDSVTKDCAKGDIPMGPNNLCTMEVADSVISGVVKKRVSSIDSNESDSGKSSKSLESSRESQELSWRKQEKQEMRSMEPEHKKPKLSASHTKTIERERSPSPSLIVKKCEKKEKNSKNEKFKASNFKLNVFTSSEKEDSDMKSGKNEFKDKIKSEIFKPKEEKRSKVRENKELSSKVDQKVKSREGRSSDRESKSGHSSNGKNRKEHSMNRNDKQKSERKSCEKSKSESSKSPRSKQEFQCLIEEEPVYFSMYDKVKARSSQNQSLKDQAKDLETMRQKFNKLKQSRAKREEKSKSVDQESDKESDSASRRSSESDTQAKTSKSKQQRKRKLVIESSSEDDLVSQSMRAGLNRHENKDFSDIASDSECEFPSLPLRHTGGNQHSKNRGRKPDLIETDSSGSESHFPLRSHVTGKKKSKLKHTQEKSTKLKIKSEDEGSEAEITSKQHNKDKEHKRKKIKKEKMQDIKSDHDTLESDTPKKFHDESKTKKKSQREDKHESDIPSAIDENTSLQSDAIKEKTQSGSQRERKTDTYESSHIDDEGKHKPFGKKKKKSKKASKNKDKRLLSDKNIEESIKKIEEMESKSSLPTLMSPKPTSPPEKPLSPPRLEAGILSDNDFKSDFSDFDFVSHRSQDIDLNAELWRHLETKADCDSERCAKSVQKKEISLSPSKLHSDITQSEPDPESSLPSFLDKICDVAGTDDNCEEHENGNKNTSLQRDENYCSPFSSFSKDKEPSIDDSLYKISYEKNNNDQNDFMKNEDRKNCGEDNIHAKDEKRKKKSKKQYKEKRRKMKEECSLIKEATDCCVTVKPSTTSLIFDQLHADDDSRLSDDIRLDEEIAEEARRLEQELLAASEETSTFGDDGPIKREEKPLERRFEEEAAKETRRLEEELFSTARESWHMKEEKPFDDPEHHPVELCSSDKEQDVINTLTIKEENIFAGLEMHAVSAIESSQHENQSFLVGQPDSDQYKIEDKDDPSDMENQRETEDALAVTALLQEMNSGEISAPELTKETDYLNPLDSHPEETMNYLLPEDSQGSLHIANNSPELHLNESQEAKLQPVGIMLSPSSNSEPPALEISNVDDTVSLKNESELKPCETETLQFQPKTEHLDEIAPEDNSAIHSFNLPTEHCAEISEQSKPPVIDIPSDPAPLEPIANVTSPKHEVKKLRKKRRKDRMHRLTVKDENNQQSNEETDYEQNSDQAENQLSHFEDITMDTADSKDEDDNPPVLQPVDSPRVLAPSPEIKEIDNLDSVSQPTKENSDTVILEEELLTSTEELISEVKVPSPPATPTEQPCPDEAKGDEDNDKNLPSDAPIITEETQDVQSTDTEIINMQNISSPVQDISEIPVSEKNCAEDKTSDIEPIVDQNETDTTAECKTDISEVEDHNDKKIGADDADSAGSATIESHISDANTESEISNLNSNEDNFHTMENKLEVQDLKANNEFEIEEKQKSDRPRRGRRPKTRKYSESTLSLPRYETSSVDLHLNPTPPKTPGKRGRPPSSERVRRSLRTDASDQVAATLETKEKNVEVKQIIPDYKSEITTYVEHDKNEEVPTQKMSEETSEIISEALPVDATNTESDGTIMHGEVQNPLCSELEIKSSDKNAEQIKSEEPKRRRGRKKKGSADHQNYSVTSNEKMEPKHEELEHKDFHRPKESRLWLSLTSEKEQKSSKENASAYDVFEFRDSEDEELTFERDLQSCVKERLLENTRSITLNYDPKHDAKAADVTLEKEKKPEEPKVKNTALEERESINKEYVTEVNQHRKISITIRLHQKDGHDGTSAGTAEVVKTSEALNIEETKAESSKTEKCGLPKQETTSGENSYNGPGKSTRKSTRLMNQAARSTVDEVIEDVVKGNFKPFNSPPLEVTPTRVTRRSRSNRRSEESIPVHPVESSEEMLEDKNKNEPVFFILDNTVKDVPDSKKVLQNQTVDTVPVADVSNNSEPDRITDRIASLRSFRITRSTANKLETNKDNSLSNNSTQSGTVHEIESLKKENLSSAASDEKKELSTFTSPPKDPVKENITQSIQENISYRPPLPVLKVELPRMVLPGAKEIFNKIEKNEDNEEDSDSRSSPAVLIDPVTGFLTPVNKNGEPTGDIQESSSLASVISALETKDRTESTVTELPEAPHVASSAACMVSDIKSISKTIPAEETRPCIKVEENDSQSKLKLSQDTLPVTQDNHQPSVPKILTTTPPALGTQAICVTQQLSIPVTISSAPLYVSSPSVVGSSESPLPLKSPKAHEKDSDYPKLYNAKSQTCAHVGVLTSTTIAPSSATLTATTTTSSGSLKAIPTGSVPTQTVTQMGQPVVPQGQQVCGWPHSTTGAPPILTFDNHPPQNTPTSIMSRASRSNVSLPSPNYQPSSRTLVTAVVTVAASGLTQANLSTTSPKAQAKCIPSTIAGLPSHATTLKSEASMTHTTTTVTQTIPQVETATCMCNKTATTNSIVASPLHSNAAVMKSEGPVSSTPGSSQVSATWTNSKASGGNRTTAPPELISHKNTVLNVPLNSNTPVAVKSETRTVQTSKVTHSHAPKNNPSYLQQAGFPVSAYEATVHSNPHGLASSSGNSGGVIAELLQNPQLLQQHKDFFAAAASGQFQERIQGQMVRPSTPVASGIPPEIAARLGSPTPPHTPTPPVTSASHSLQPPEIHPAHVAAGLHLRHPTQPPLIVPPHPPLGIHPSELNAYVHQQMIYAAAHPHYAAIHPELRAQQEAQARAAVAMGITPRFAYPPIPPAAVPPSSFRQPLDPRLPHPSATDIKSENKPVVESTKVIHEHRVSEDKTQQPVKPVRIKQEIEKDLKVIHSDINRLEEPETSRPHSAHDKVSVSSAVPPHGGSLRPQHIPYSSAIRQLSPHLTVSPHERITDSPVVANLYTQGQNRVPPVQLAGQIDDHKESVMLSQQAHHIKSESQERDIKPPIAHQTLPSTIPYHTLEPTVHPARQPLLGVPQVGSPAPGYVDNRSLSQSAHSPGSLTYKKDTGHPQTNTIISQMHTPGEKRTNQDISKKVVHTRTHGHQGPSSISPGPAGLGTAHSPLPWPPGIQPHNTHPVAQPPHSMIPPSEQSTRRGNLHVTPQMGSEVPVHAPPPAHAMSQPTSVPRTQPQTPPHASQVPPQGDSFLLQRYPVMWQGLLALKNDQAAVQMHFVSGNPRIARASLPPMAEGGTPPVRIAQRMRLEQTQLEGVARKMQMVDEHCILLALPCGRDHMDVLQQSNNLRNGFINYLQLKQAAGIVNAAAPGSQQPAYVIHIFPSCDFSDNNLARIAPDLLHSVSDIAHLLIIIATV